MVIATDTKPVAPGPSLQARPGLRAGTDYGQHLHARASKRLSPRERQVLELVGRGLSTQVVADQLQIQTRTIDLHCWKIKIKLGLFSQRELANFAQTWVGLPGSAAIRLISTPSLKQRPARAA